jgi:hypothetical protein
VTSHAELQCKEVRVDVQLKVFRCSERGLNTLCTDRIRGDGHGDIGGF